MKFLNKNFLIPFSITLGSFILFFYLTRAWSALFHAAGNTGSFLQFLLYNFGWVFSVAIIFAFQWGAFFAVHKLRLEKKTGEHKFSIPPIKIIKSLLIFSTLAVAGMFYFNLNIVPELNYQYTINSIYPNDDSGERRMEPSFKNSRNMTGGELREEIDQIKNKAASDPRPGMLRHYEKEIRIYQSQYYKLLTLALGCLVMTLLGTATGMARGVGKHISNIILAVITITYYFSFSVLEKMIVFEKFPAYFLFLPSIIIAAFALVILLIFNNKLVSLDMELVE